MNEIKIILIANAGIIIEYNEQQILIDAIHEGHMLYHPTPLDAMENLIAGKPPFKHILALLFSHNHLDHFSARLTLPVLQSHPESLFIADELSAAELQQYSLKSSKYIDHSRIHALPWCSPQKNNLTQDTGTQDSLHSTDIIIGDFTIRNLSFEHEGRRFVDLPNIGFLITIAGFTILFPGDARMSPDNFKELAHTCPKIDVAVVMFPYIATGRGQTLLRDIIKPGQIVAVHWPDPKRDSHHFIINAKNHYEKTKDSLVETSILENYMDTATFGNQPGSANPSISYDREK